MHHLTYQNIGNEKEDELLLVCRKCHYAIHRGNYLVLRNINGKDFIESDIGNEILDALKHTKIIKIYFSKDKISVLDGKHFVFVGKDGKEKELDKDMWYVEDKSKIS